MARLTWVALVGACFMAGPVSARPDPLGRWHHLVEGAARRFGLPAPWVWRVMRAESGGRLVWNGRPITSSAGAMGLMQLMPGTWREMRDAHGLGPDPYLPRDNILAGTAYLRRMYDRFGFPDLFAAYHAGPGRVARVRAGAGELPQATRAYLAQTAPGWPHAPPARSWGPRAARARAGTQTDLMVTAPGIFFPLRSVPLSGERR